MGTGHLLGCAAHEPSLWRRQEECITDHQWLSESRMAVATDRGTVAIITEGQQTQCFKELHGIGNGLTAVVRGPSAQSPRHGSLPASLPSLPNPQKASPGP